MSKGTIAGGGTDGEYDVTIDMLDGSPQTMQAWCGDLTEDLSGEVGVIEIAGDIDKGVNIQPGYDGNAAYDASRDGEMKQVQKFPNSEPTQEIYWNWAMRPGWQKWRSKYRYGSITSIDYDADTCSVNLDACLATDTPDGKALDVNQSSSLSGVSIDYMDCNSSAFEVGDEVLIELDHGVLNGWINPKVIGFKDNPQACYWENWQKGICGNHTWYVEQNHRPAELDPTQSVSGNCIEPGNCFSLSPGHLIMRDEGNYFWQVKLKASEQVDDITRMQIKTTYSGCAGSGSSGGEYSFGLYLNGNAHWFRIWITYATPPPLLPYRHDISGYLNAEGVYDVPLADFGFSVPITTDWVSFLMTSFGYCAANADLEWINFI